MNAAALIAYWDGEIHTIDLCQRPEANTQPIEQAVERYEGLSNAKPIASLCSTVRILSAMRNRAALSRSQPANAGMTGVKPGALASTRREAALW